MITLSSIITGAIIGWIAYGIMGIKGGFFRIILTGIVGSFLGNAIFKLIGFTAHGFLASLFVGVVGWIAYGIMDSKGGFFRIILTGIVGSFLGNAIFKFMGFTAHGFLASLFVGVVGACVFIAVGRKLFG